MQSGLPEIDPATGFLPPGIHLCSWADFEQRFVVEAPHPEHRRRRMQALQVYVACLEHLLPGATLWLDGGFVSHKAAPPFDIDVVAIVDPAAWAHVATEAQTEMEQFSKWLQGGQVGDEPKTPTLTQLGGLMTHKLAQTADTGAYPRMQPFGGLIDSFIVPSNAEETLQYFKGIWTSDYKTGHDKGLVEVRPDGAR